MKLTKKSVAVGVKLRALFERSIKKAVGREKRVALLLSGGVDSTVAGIATHRAGYEVEAYTFQLGDKPNFDSKWAQHTAKTMGWRWNLIKLPTDVRDVLALLPTMYRDYSCRNKRNFECLWPLLLTYPHVREKHVVAGMMADNHCYLTRKAMKMGATGKDGDKRVFDKMRHDAFDRLHREGDSAFGPDYNPSNAWMNLQVERKYGKVGVDPFRDKAVFDLFIQFSWWEMHSPRQKHFIAGTYPEVLQYVGWRNHQNYQLAGKIDDHFELLLDTPFNFRKRGRTLEMFADVRRYPEEVSVVLDKLESKYGERAKKLQARRKQ